MIIRVIKTLLIVIASVMHVSDVLAQGIIVYKSDGTMEKISYAAIDSIVSYANDENKGDEPKIEIHEAIDLGLSVKWASCNVGASSPEESGGYYAWGEIEEKTNYDWSTYKWCKGSYDSLTKYCTNRYYGTVDNKATLDPEDDVAHVKWGGDWRMPTLNEIKELCEKCSWQWTEVNSVSGHKVTGPNGNSIFLPAAGYLNGTEVKSYGSYGIYSSSILDTTGYSNTSVYTLDIDYGGVQWSFASRFIGFTVRPVTK